MNKIEIIQNQMILQILLSSNKISKETYDSIRQFDTEVQSKLIVKLIGSEV